MYQFSTILTNKLQIRAFDFALANDSIRLAVPIVIMPLQTPWPISEYGISICCMFDTSRTKIRLCETIHPIAMKHKTPDRMRNWFGWSRFTILELLLFSNRYLISMTITTPIIKYTCVYAALESNWVEWRQIWNCSWLGEALMRRANESSKYNEIRKRVGAFNYCSKSPKIRLNTYIAPDTCADSNLLSRTNYTYQRSIVF